MRRASTFLPLAAVLLAALLAACSATSTPSPTSAPSPEPTTDAGGALTPIRLSLGYIPDVQFAPFYVGIEKGFFAERGIDLMTEHRQETDGARLVATGEIKFAVVSGEQVLLAREQGLPLVYVFEWYQRFPVAVAAKADSGIATPGDLAGRSVGTPVKEGASYIGLEALLGAAGLTDEDIDLQTTGYSQVETLISDRVDAVVVYVTNEPVQLEAAGEAINVIEVADYADLVSNGLVTSEDVIAENPDLVRAMVAGLAESVEYTIAHPDEAFAISQGYVEGLDDPATAETAREVLARSVDLWKGDPVGFSQGESWEIMQQVLLDTGLLSDPQAIDAAYTNEFLP
jgi:NitT/TauT family transport system substrate-binding protein